MDILLSLSEKVQRYLMEALASPVVRFFKDLIHCLHDSYLVCRHTSFTYVVCMYACLDVCMCVYVYMCICVYECVYACYIMVMLYSLPICSPLNCSLAAVTAISSWSCLY